MSISKHRFNFDATYEEMVVSVLEVLPKEVVLHVRDNVAFHFLETNCCIPKDAAEVFFTHEGRFKDLILLYVDEFLENHFMSVIAHEIAHSYLGKSFGMGKDLANIEREVDALVAQWGFNKIYT